MAGEVVFGVFVAAMVVLAGFVVRFSMRLNRDARARQRRGAARRRGRGPGQGPGRGPGARKAPGA